MHHARRSGLIAIRKEHNHTQEYVAAYLGLERSAYAQCELGKVLRMAPEHLFKLAQLYGCSMEHIYRLCYPIEEEPAHA